MQTLMKNVSTIARPCASVGAVPFNVASVNATGTSLNGINIDTGLPGSGDNRDNIENKSLANGDQGSVCGPDDKYNETDDDSDPEFDDEADITEHSDSRNEDDSDGDGEGDADVVEYIDLDDNQEECAGCEDELEEYNGAKAESHQYMAASTEEDEEDDLPATHTNIVEGMEDPVVNHSMNGSNELQYETVDVVANQCSKKMYFQCKVSYSMHCNCSTDERKRGRKV
ncbi:uncharacterized protein [Miscanthus floridulus]|uniref:uncharacterized protein n=1 Tax=Miscanthus floridulus TaxID=154761 RepID=UPI003459EA11